MDRCPRCGEPLEAGIGACPSCGWMALGQPQAPQVPRATTAPAGAPVTRPLPPLPAPPPPPGGGAPPLTDIGVRWDGRLLTFAPRAAEGGLGGPDPRADPKPLLRVLAYVMLLIMANALLYGYIGLQEIRLTELVEVPGPNNTTRAELRTGDINPLAVLTIVYTLVVLEAAPAVAYGLLRRRRWAWNGTIVATVISLGVFPIGTLVGPAVIYLLTRPLLRDALDAPMAGWSRPPPYGEEQGK